MAARPQLPHRPSRTERVKTQHEQAGAIPMPKSLALFPDRLGSGSLKKSELDQRAAQRLQLRIPAAENLQLASTVIVKPLYAPLTGDFVLRDFGCPGHRKLSALLSRSTTARGVPAAKGADGVVLPHNRSAHGRHLPVIVVGGSA